MFNSSENIKKQINMENKLIPFSNFDDVKVGDKVNCNVFPMEIVEKYGIVLETD